MGPHAHAEGTLLASPALRHVLSRSPSHHNQQSDPSELESAQQRGKEDFQMLSWADNPESSIVCENLLLLETLTLVNKWIDHSKLFLIEQEEPYMYFFSKSDNIESYIHKTPTLVQK